MTIQMLSQVNPKISKILIKNLDLLKNELGNTYYDLPLIKQAECEELIDKYTLKILNEIEEKWTTQKTMD